MMQSVTNKSDLIRSNSTVVADCDLGASLRGVNAHEWQQVRLFVAVVCMLSLISPITRGAEVAGTRNVDTQPTTVMSSPADDRIREDVRNLLISDPDTRIFDLAVEVQSGIVTLYGRVGTSAEKHLAARYAGDVLGVAGVVNAIKVQPVLRQKPLPDAAATGAERKAIVAACGDGEGNKRQLGTAACIARLDRNGDGALNRDEAAYFAALGKRFSELDVDGGGQLTPGEVKRYFGAAPAARAGASGLENRSLPASP